MKVLVHIGHPAHVHFFKNMIWKLEEDGYEVEITTMEKDITTRLLNSYNFRYYSIGKNVNGLVKKSINLIRLNYNLYLFSRRAKPDIFVSMCSPYAAQVSFLLRKPHIGFGDTEHSRLIYRLSLPFTDAFCTPSCFNGDYGLKHIKYKGYHELAYLYPNHFKPDPTILEEHGLDRGKKFIIMRFVSWKASHDSIVDGLTLENKKKAVKEFEKYGQVLITSESPLPSEFEKYRISVPPEKIHDLMYYATLLYGESATMASECAVLGTHAIFCDFAGRGYTDEQEDRYDLVYNFKLDEESQSSSIEKAVSLLENDNLKRDGEQKRDKLLSEKIDVTKFMTDFVEGYPDTFYKYHIDEP